MVNNSVQVELQVRERAFNRRILTFAIVNKGHINIEAFLNDSFNIYESEVTKTLEKFNIVKSSTVFAAEFERKNDILNEQSVRINHNYDGAHASTSSTTENESAQQNNRTQNVSIILI